MKRMLILIAFFTAAVGLVPAVAGETKLGPSAWRYSAHGHDLPFPRSKRAEAVWASGACWSECGAYCAWGLSGCLRTDRQGRCLQLTDACDRYCQRECRIQGGPLLPIDF